MEWKKQTWNVNHKQTNMQGQWSLTFHVAAFRRKKAKFAWKQIRKVIPNGSNLKSFMLYFYTNFIELYLKPIVDLIQCKLSSAGLIDCLKKFLFRIVLTSRSQLQIDAIELLFSILLHNSFDLKLTVLLYTYFCWLHNLVLYYCSIHIFWYTFVEYILLL